MSKSLRKPSKERKHPTTFSCYSPKKHDCDDRCQGASDCILAQGGSRVTRKMMRKYMKSVFIWHKFWEKLSRRIDINLLYADDLVITTELEKDSFGDTVESWRKIWKESLEERLDV